jgi:hypothetical protein
MLYMLTTIMLTYSFYNITVYIFRHPCPVALDLNAIETF